jgi:hypothetical protein
MSLFGRWPFAGDLPFAIFPGNFTKRNLLRIGFGGGWRFHKCGRQLSSRGLEIHTVLSHEYPGTDQVVVCINMDRMKWLSCFSSLLLSGERTEVLARTFRGTGENDGRKQNGGKADTPLAVIVSG